MSLPTVGEAGASGDACGELESTKSVSDVVSPVLDAPVEAVSGDLVTDLPVTGELGLENVGRTAVDLAGDVTGGDVTGGDITGDLVAELPIAGDLAGGDVVTGLVGDLTGDLAADLTGDLPVVGSAEIPVVSDLVSVDSILEGIL